MKKELTTKPIPSVGESEGDFVSRCIPIVLDEGTAQDNDQAAAICYSIYREHSKSQEERKQTTYKVKASGIGKLSIKDVDTVGRTVTGFFNTFHFFDSDRDVLLPGAAKRSIKERGPKSEAVAKIKHAISHDLTQLPGKIMHLEEKMIDNINGIYFETKMADTTLGQDTLKNYLAGIFDNHSIGFQYKQVEMIERDAKGWDKVVEQLHNPEALEGVSALFAVKEIALFEGSTVAFGANTLTPFLGIKSGNKEAYTIALFQKMDKMMTALKSGTQSDEMMSAIELQVLQIKQMISELTDQFILSRKTKEKEGIDNGVNKKQQKNKIGTPNLNNIAIGFKLD